MDAPESFDVLT